LATALEKVIVSLVIECSVKVKVTLEHARKAQRESSCIAVLFNLGASWGGLSTPRLGRFSPKKETRYPLYMRLGGPQSRFGRVRQVPPPGFIFRTVRPIA
jgi:hypothetical protein